MEQRVIYERFPVFILDVPRRETDIDSLDGMIGHFRRRIDAHRHARFVGVFDHYAHTRELADGEIAEGIRDARNIVFCFGLSIPNPEILALRPRSIGICELDDRFVISFLETPMPVANAAMEQWAHAVLRRHARGTSYYNNVSMRDFAPIDDPQ
jgi:hypothetical protein